MLWMVEELDLVGVVILCRMGRVIVVGQSGVHGWML